jgi:hypothetical protein
MTEKPKRKPPATPQSVAAQKVRQQMQSQVKTLYSMPPEINDDSPPVRQHNWI